MIDHYEMRPDDDGMYPASVLVFYTLTNEDRNIQFSSWVDQVPADRRPTFRELQAEWGRCNSRVYADTVTGVEEIGYYFVKRQRYEDTGEPYLRGAWVTFMDVPELDFLPATVREVQQAIELLVGS